MALTAEDIVDHHLDRAMRGYSVAQVDALLDEAADTVEELRGQIVALRERASAAETRLEEISETEDRITRALVTAEEVADRSVAEAEARADAIVEEAREEAGRIREEAAREAREMTETARDDLEELRGRLEQLRRIEAQHRHELREQLEEHLALLDRPPALEGSDPVDEAAEDVRGRAEDVPAGHADDGSRRDDADGDGTVRAVVVDDAAGSGADDGADGEERARPGPVGSPTAGEPVSTPPRLLWAAVQRDTNRGR